MLSKKFWLLIVLCLLFDDVGSKISSSGRGGYGRGSSASRGSSLGRGSSFGRSGSGGGSNYGVSSSGRHMGAANRGSNYGSNTGYRPPSQSSSGSGKKGILGGLIGGRSGSHHGSRGMGGGMGSGGRSGGILGGLTGRKNHYGGGRHHGYSKGSGVGSMLRSNTFKNVIVGAAAGYLAYQGGKYLIRSAMAPMMWNNRPYYWGQNYYQPRPNTQMCRMPVDANDQQLGNIYFQDQTRPREIVWSCGMGEYCCGYECCPNSMGGGMGAGMGGGGIPMGGGAGMAPAIGAGAGMGAGGMGRNYGDANEGSLSVRPAQSIGVRGQLRCNGMPAAGILVKLYDHDTFTLDDKIAEGRSDGQGNFIISGHANEVTRITPKFNIYHDCNDWLPCQRKVSMYIPKNFVTQGEIAQNIYDAGVLELSGKFEGEERDCLHK